MEERLHGGNQISAKFVVVDFERAIHNAHNALLFSSTIWSGYRTLMDRTLPSTQGGSEAYNYAFRRLVFT